MNDVISKGRADPRPGLVTSAPAPTMSLFGKAAIHVVDTA